MHVRGSIYVYVVSVRTYINVYKGLKNKLTKQKERLPTKKNKKNS